MYKIAGIRRQSLYSPNHVENDALIIMKTAEHLINMGASVNIFDEQDIGSIEIKEPIIFSMVQGKRASEKLLELEDQGKLIINSPQSVMNCYRTNMVKILPLNGIPFPKSFVLPVSDKNGIQFKDFNSRKIWVKRGDVHAVHREDVTLVYSEEERKNIFREFEKRGIEEAIVQEHLDGDVIKFYSVKGSSLFHWYYLNGTNHTPFNQEKLFELAAKSAEAMGLDVFGGDAVISADGSITIIDVNDWPSFAPIKEQASVQIAQLIFQKAIQYDESLLKLSHK